MVLLLKRSRLWPKWQLLTTGPGCVEKILNSVNYVIRKVDGRDRRVVHIDRLQHYDEATPDNDVLTNQRSTLEAASDRRHRPEKTV